jgi:hypothetical protein
MRLVRRRLGYFQDGLGSASEPLQPALGGDANQVCRTIVSAPLILSKPMKHKFSINIRFVLGVIAIGCIGLSGTAFAQNPRMFPTATPNSSGSSEQGTVKSKLRF